MAKDSGKWESAYISYNKRFPKSKHNITKPKPKKIQYLSKEPMLLQEEYNDIKIQMVKLRNRKHQIKREMRKFKINPIERSAYFDRPILLYALKLEDSCWYVGMSRNVDRRLKSHKKGSSLWTKAHSPLSIFEVRETGLSSDSEVSKLEDEMTIEYAIKYGTDKVRGGGYCQTKPRWPTEALYPELSYKIG